MSRHIPRWAWAVWGAVGALMEAVALSRKGDNTLSSTLRWALGIEPRRPWWAAGVLVVLGFCGWLPLHLTGVL